MSGASAKHQPGVHYFATRLFDLDFARIGRIERHEGSQELIDFPRGTGQIAYRKRAQKIRRAGTEQKPGH
jgi:hypothetical protein